MTGWREEPPYGRVALPATMFGKQEGAASGVLPRPIGTRLGQDLDRLPHRVDRQQAEAEQAAKPPRPPVVVTPAAGSAHRQPHLVCGGQAVDALQHEVQRETE